MSDQNLDELKNAIAQAKESLSAEDSGTGGKTFGTESEELEYLRKRERERQEREAVQGLVQEVASGIKTTQAEEQARLQTMVAQELTKALGGEAAQGLVAGAIARASAQRLNRAYQPDVSTGMGTKGGGTYIPSHRLGEKDNFHTFLCAVGRKDRATIRDLQAAHGMNASNGYGNKALIEAGAAVDAVGGPSGGFLVPVDWGRSIVEALTAQVALRRAGPVIQTMTSPQFRQPRQTGLATAAYVGETAAIPSSQESFDQLSLSAKKLSCLVPCSAELIEDSDPSVADIVTRDATRALALKEDLQFLTGTGSSTAPQGILTASGTTQITATGTNGDAITYGTVVDLDTQLDVDNVPNIRRVWFANPRIKGALRKVLDSTGRPIFAEYLNPQDTSLAGSNATLLGYPVYTTSQLSLGTTGTGATADLALVEMSQVLLGQLAELEVKVSDEASYVDGSNNNISAWQQDLLLFRVIARHDITLMHTKAVVRRQGLLY